MWVLIVQDNKDISDYAIAVSDHLVVLTRYWWDARASDRAYPGVGWDQRERQISERLVHEVGQVTAYLIDYIEGRKTHSLEEIKSYTETLKRNEQDRHKYLAEHNKLTNPLKGLSLIHI